MKAPVEAVRAVMKAVCFILYPNPSEKKKDGLKTVVDWWAASIKLLGNDFINVLKGFEKEKIEEKCI